MFIWKFVILIVFSINLIVCYNIWNPKEKSVVNQYGFDFADIKVGTEVWSEESVLKNLHYIKVHLNLFQKTYSKVHSLYCTAAENLCDNLICKMKPMSHTKTLFSAQCLLHAPINEMMVTFVIEAKNSKNIYWMWANETMDYCKKINSN